MYIYVYMYICIYVYMNICIYVLYIHLPSAPSATGPCPRDSTWCKLASWLAGWHAGWLEEGPCKLQASLWLEVDSSVSRWEAQNPLVWGQNPSSWGPKSTKLGAKIFQNRPQGGSWRDLGTILALRCHLERTSSQHVNKSYVFWGSSWGPKPPKIGPKSDPKGDHFFDRVGDRFLDRFGANLGTSWTPKSSKRRPSWFQNQPKLGC